MTTQLRLFLACSVMALAACGSPAAPTPAPTQPAAPTKAPAPTQPPPPTAVPTPAPTPTPAARVSEVTALWFGQDAGGPIGGTSKVKVTLSPNPGAKELRVGFFESEVGGSGGQWRASGWMAALIASLLTGETPNATQYSFDVAGRIDGPSAGALMTVAVLAAMKGDKVRDDAAMTGTINPDGTIGPVGGVPQKIEGAAAAGKKLVLVPAGQRMELDLKTKRLVDVVDKGKSLNVEVKEVGDIFAAYEALTGKPLNVVALPTTRPEVSSVVFDKMKQKATAWNVRYIEEVNNYKLLPDALKIDEVEGLMTQAEQAATRGDKLFKQGVMTGAYNQMQQAAALALVANQVAQAIQLFATRGFDGTIKQLEANASSLNAKSAALVEKLKGITPKTVSDAGALTNSYSRLVEALGIARQGERILQKKVNNQAEALEVIITGALYYKLAGVLMDAIPDVWDVGGNLEGPALPADAPLEQTAEFFRRAAEANLNLFESVVIESEAQAAGVRTEAVKTGLQTADLTYGVTRNTMDKFSTLDKLTGGSGPALAYAQMGAALSAYKGTNELIAKYYSLDAELDQNFTVTGIGREKAMQNMLDLADEQARRGIAGLTRNKVDNALPALIYESARLNREGRISEKMDALSSFWDAYSVARAMAYVGKFANK